MSDKEYKARLLYIDAGDCKEVWEVKHINGGRQYVGRDTFDEHTWWTLCDAPYGYCERSGRIVPGVVFILCDAEWNPVARDGNDRTEFPTPYPTLEKQAPTLGRLSGNNILKFPKMDSESGFQASLTDLYRVRIT